MPELLLLGLIGAIVIGIGIKYGIYKCDVKDELNVHIGGVEVPDNEIPPKYEDIVIN